MPRLLQVLREAAHALFRFQVPVVKNHAAHGVLGKHEAAVVVQLRAVYADHHHLPDFLGERHPRGDRLRPLLRRHPRHDPRRPCLRRPRLRRPAAAAQQSERQKQQRKKQPDSFLSHLPCPHLPNKSFYSTRPKSGAFASFSSKAFVSITVIRRSSAYQSTLSHGFRT